MRSRPLPPSPQMQPAAAPMPRKPEPAPPPRMRTEGYTERTHHGNPGRKPFMRHGG